MANVKLLLKIFDVFFMSIWGLTVVDLMKVTAQTEVLLNIDNTIKTVMAAIGAIYLLIQIPHRLKTQSQDRELKREQIKKIKRENELDKKD